MVGDATGRILSAHKHRFYIGYSGPDTSTGGVDVSLASRRAIPEKLENLARMEATWSSSARFPNSHRGETITS